MMIAEKRPELYEREFVSLYKLKKSSTAVHPCHFTTAHLSVNKLL